MIVMGHDNGNRTHAIFRPSAVKRTIMIPHTNRSRIIKAQRARFSYSSKLKEKKCSIVMCASQWYFKQSAIFFCNCCLARMVVFVALSRGTLLGARNVNKMKIWKLNGVFRFCPFYTRFFFSICPVAVARYCCFCVCWFFASWIVNEIIFHLHFPHASHRTADQQQRRSISQLWIPICDWY